MSAPTIAELHARPWPDLTPEDKRRLRRAARAEANERERARRAAAHPPKPEREPRPRPVPLAPIGARLSGACEDGDHRACGRPFTCQCPCHQTQETQP